MNIDYFMPTKIISGKNCVKDNSSVFASFGKKCLIVTGGRSAKLSGALDDCLAALADADCKYSIFSGIEPNPSAKTCMEAGKIAKEQAADFIVGIGGGSVLDAAKAVALFACTDCSDHMLLYSRSIPSQHLPVVLIGTTAGTGSEVTGVSVMTNPDTGRKKSISGPDCYADVSFCDYLYTCSLPHSVTVSTALDAFSHALEAYLASSCNEITAAFSFKAIDILTSFIKCNFDCAMDENARENLYLASIYAGLAINKAGTDFPHTVGYYLTENYNVAHGNACAVFCPVLLDRAEKYCPEKLGAIEELMGLKKNGIASLVRNAAAVDVKIGREEAYAVAERWRAGVKNFDRSPGGFTVEDAAEALISF